MRYVILILAIALSGLAKAQELKFTTGLSFIKATEVNYIGLDRQNIMKNNFSGMDVSGGVSVPFKNGSFYPLRLSVGTGIYKYPIGDMVFPAYISVRYRPINRVVSPVICSTFGTVINKGTYLNIPVGVDFLFGKVNTTVYTGYTFIKPLHYVSWGLNVVM